MHRVLLLGAGKIGRAIAAFLHSTGDYDIVVADSSADALQKLAAEFAPVKTVHLDASDRRQLSELMTGRECVISALAYAFNPLIAEVAVETETSYFDLTEDVATTRAVRDAAERCVDGKIVMPQCGLAPGFISIAAHDIASQFESLDKVHMRVGALPQFPTNRLKYNLTWSTDGLINEYCNPCIVIHDGQIREVLPLEGLQEFSLDGIRYEAFNTSGGLGSLCETLQGKVNELNYRTVRYPGHQSLMQFLIRDLKMSEKRAELKRILEDAIPVTYQDVVITFVSVSGIRGGQYMQVSDARRIYHQHINDRHWGAIQVTTAAGICAAVDLYFNGQLPRRGFVRQEDISLTNFLANRFGCLFGQDESQFSAGAED